MRKILLLPLIFMGMTVNAQTSPANQWTWLNGSKTIPAFGIYGTKGVASVNTYPGARNYARTWTDASGNQFFFGGYGYSYNAGTSLNDMWKYNPSTSEWTYLNGDSVGNVFGVYGTKGTAAAANKPGTRQTGASCKDAAGNFYIFGGVGAASSGSNGYLNDLWRYNPTTNQWTWLSGDNVTNSIGVYGTKGTANAANKPGAKNGCTMWADGSGNLWVFGGNGYASVANAQGYTNDLWRYNISSGQWTWMSGDNVVNSKAVYGTKGTANAANKPGSRYDFVGWQDAGNLYIFGGSGYNASSFIDMNDLWRYNISSGQWTWLTGESTGSSYGVYGTKGIANAANKPGCRAGAFYCSNANNTVFYLFGGRGNAASSGGTTNDLWSYTVSSGQWTWIGGDNTANNTGVYGTKGVEDATGKPGSRQYGTMWMDASANIFIQGGGANLYNTDMWKFNTSNGRWTWVNGDPVIFKSPVYNTMGVADSVSQPGVRQYATNWKDKSGNLWLFGGSAILPSGYATLADLWKYNIASGQWTWVKGTSLPGQGGVYGTKGIADTANRPGMRQGAFSWTDNAGRLWLSGGSGYATGSNYGNLNDLWMFDPAANAWTWVSGDNTPNSIAVYGTKNVPAATNIPGARQYGATWTDANGKFWLFGGDGYTDIEDNQGTLNDLWRYDPVTNEWTWMSGSNEAYTMGVYGTKGIAAAGNMPGGHMNGNTWTDASGNLWLFGGNGQAAASGGSLNDLWMYNIASGQWTWMSGSNAANQFSVYGTQGTAAAGNIPGARLYAANWTDLSGNLWLFGGNGLAASGSSNNLNDLWKYDITSGQWTWVSGDNTTQQSGVYGTKGTADPANKPGARQYALSWTGDNGALYLYSGNGNAAAGNGGLNDLWRFATVPITPLPVTGLELTAQKQQETIELKWQTKSELNNDYFVAERSADGRNYENLGTVAASNNIRGGNYQLTDIKPLHGDNFYRVKQVDKNGAFVYSKVVRVNMSGTSNGFYVVQNPVNDVLILNISTAEAQKVQLIVRDAAGRTILHSEQQVAAGTSNCRMPVDKLSQGAYFISVMMKEGAQTATFIR